MSNSGGSVLPTAWNKEAHTLWLKGDIQQAIIETVNWLNSLDKTDKSNEQLQLAYYFYFTNDYVNASQVMQDIVKNQPQNQQALVNLAVCFSRLGQFEQAVEYALLANQVKEDYLAYDVLSNAYNQLNNPEKASDAGTNALRCKDINVEKLNQDNEQLKNWHLPAVSPQTFTQKNGRRSVIAFSLWGTNPRYLRGALQNMLLAPRYFPNWQLRFYMDDSVPVAISQLLSIMGAQVFKMPSNQPLRTKLTWRFHVANDPFVGRFLVRDVDSIFSERESHAVHEWLASDKWFHLIRDWWTHTDLILAGLWGGVAGVLPSIQQLLAEYKSTAVETPNIDQWFLRDSVWPYIKQSCLAHDRCFHFDGTPLPDGPGTAASHVGQNEFAVNEAAQAQMLVDWINSAPTYDWQAAGTALGFIKNPPENS